MINLIAKKVEECEKEAKSYVIEGFPRNKVQALALEELGIVPDKVINLGSKDCPSMDAPNLGSVEPGKLAPSLLPLFA